MVSLKAGGPVYPCPCGFDPVDGWTAKLGVAATYFVHCPDCDRWAYGVTEDRAQAAWNLRVVGLVARLGVTLPFPPVAARVA